MTKELEKAIQHIKTRADAWAVKEVTEALQSISERLDKALSQEPCDTYTEGYFKGYDDGLEQKLEEPTEKPMTVDEMEREYEKSKALFHKIVECDDAISREAVREILAKYHLGESRIAEELNELPSVTHKSGKWVKVTNGERWTRM